MKNNPEQSGGSCYNQGFFIVELSLYMAGILLPIYFAWEIWTAGSVSNWLSYLGGLFAQSPFALLPHIFGVGCMIVGWFLVAQSVLHARRVGN